MNQINPLLPKIAEPVRGVPPGKGPVVTPKREFDTELDSADVKFSAHARKRLDRRGMDVTANQTQKLSRAIDRAAAKGSKTSLVLLDELALLVSVPERVVVTAMSPGAMRDGVVTQIDSAVVA